MKRIYYRILVLSVLALIFTAPAPVAYFFFTHPQYLTAHTSNKGQLLGDNAPVIALNGSDASWHLVLFHQKPCKVACIKTLEKLKRVRLALGRHYYAVDEWLLTPVAITLPRDLSVPIKTINPGSQEGIALFAQHADIFIVDAAGRSVMAYPETASLEAIYHDLRQLLRSSGKISE